MNPKPVSPRRATAGFLFALAACLAIGAAFRVPSLCARTMHGDEAVHTVKCDELWRTGRYVYDPHEYHGPTLYYATLPIWKLSGATSFAQTSEATFRIVPVLFGLGLILLLPLVADGLGRGAALAAALLTALSPALVYYSRYYIQETLLVFFTLLTIAAAWRWICAGRVVWACVAGAGIGLMHATKETSLIVWGCLACAALLTWRTQLRARAPAPLSPKLRGWHAAVVVAAAAAVSALFFSAFFTNAAGPLDSIRAYATYFGRAGGDGEHAHPWDYYARLLLLTQRDGGPVFSEALIALLAAWGFVSAFLRRPAFDKGRAFVRFVAVYSLLLAVAYSALPYKTPWLALGFWHGFILMAGYGVARLFERVRGWPMRAALALALAAGAGHLAIQSGRVVGRFASDWRNPYVYAHPLNGVVDAARWIERLSQVHPDGDRMVVKVVTSDPWPLPWYLRRLERVGYWATVPPADPLDAPVVVSDAEIHDKVAARLHDTYRDAQYYGLRRAETLEVWVERSLWRAFAERERGGSADPARQ